MFCPQCRSEYRQGFTRCKDCDVDLVWELPPEDHDVNLVKVFESGDPALIPIAESLLRNANIECVVRNKRLPDAYRTNILLGPAQFWVREDEADAARAVLAELE
jgi:hypothetical protein